MSLKVVKLREEPLLNDIPGQLRAMADEIERGGYGGIDSATMLLVHDDMLNPLIFTWGAVQNRHTLAGLLAAAQSVVLTVSGESE